MITELFPTVLYSGKLSPDTGTIEAFNQVLEKACLQIAEDDEAGQHWCEDNGYDGYTSYASLNDLNLRDPNLGLLADMLSEHAGAFARSSGWNEDLTFEMDSFWINILNPLAAHSGHIHPHSVISGTYYVKTPAGSGAIKFEDPRLAMMMAAPMPAQDAPEDRQRFVYRKPSPGGFLMWESWLRHEVCANQAEDLRISISFNFSLA